MRLDIVEKTPRSKCCGKQMITTMELGRFVEMRCTACGDLVYMKQYSQSFADMTGWKEGVEYQS